MIRVMKKEEYPKLVQILKESFAPGSLDKRLEDRFKEKLGIDWWVRKEEDLKMEVNRNPEGAFVAEIEGQIAGFITTYLQKNAKVGRVCALSIKKDCQGKGIGTKLIEQAVKYFKENGMKLVRIEVLEDNLPAYKLYKKLGFNDFAKQVHLVKDISGGRNENDN